MQQVATKLLRIHTGDSLMGVPLSPIVSEFETEEQASSHDLWFRAKVEKSLANPGPGVPHDEVMARAEAIILEAERKQRAKA